MPEKKTKKIKEEKDKKKQKKKKQPSLRMLGVFRKVLETKGKTSVSQAMREEGYPATTAKNPQQLTRSKSWQNLLQEAFPDNVVAEVHNQLLNAFRLEHQVFPLAVEDEDIVNLLDSTNCTVIKIQYGEQAKHVYFWASDNMARDRALDKIYKIKGRYAPQKIKIIDPNEDLTDEEIEEEIARREKRRKLNKKPVAKKKG